MRSTVTELEFGTGAQVFTGVVDRAEADWPVVRALGIRTHSHASELLETLVRLRDGAPTPDDARVTAMYIALASLCPTGELTADSMIDDTPLPVLRNAFSRGKGLVFSGGRWWRRGDVFLGRAIFGDRRGFLPRQSRARRLWRALGIEEPSIGDCVTVLAEIAQAAMAQETVAATVHAIYTHIDTHDGDDVRIARRQLKGLPLWTSGGWRTTRPIFVVDDPGLAHNLGVSGVPVWEPPKPVGAYPRLRTLLSLSPVGSEHIEVGAADALGRAAGLDLAIDLSAAVGQLQALLQETDVALVEACDWPAFASADVVVVPDLTLIVQLPGFSAASVSVEAYFDPGRRMLHVRDEAALTDRDAGGRAIASLFPGVDHGAIPMLWDLAWRELREGRVLGRIDVPEEPTEADTGGVEPDTSGASKGRRRRSARSAPGPASSPMGPAQPPALKDPAEMRIVSTSAGGASEERSGRRGRRGHSDPPADYKPPPRPERRVEKPWGAVDLTTREGVALDLLRQAVRQEYADELTDISFYGRAGADARGTSGRFYEIKIASAGLTKTVPFRASQLSRALTMRERFVLVVVSGLLKGSGRAIVLFFPDPLNRLDIARSVDFELTGVTEGREVRRIEFE